MHLGVPLVHYSLRPANCAVHRLEDLEVEVQCRSGKVHTNFLILGGLIDKSLMLVKLSRGCRFCTYQTGRRNSWNCPFPGPFC